MIRLATVLYSIVGTSLAGTFVIASLTAGYDTLVPILIAAAAGFVLALPASVLIARAILRR
ncbi:CTP synthetase [Palleronia sediminis]|uniref:CTP synthetase n=1 Tax=Palleronia sediminis TaxID=2547833 RepID=A0A4R6AK54_9RHOB|nr:CTP synthetase [Palleronia sediminis]TDL81843.1 CTP synthetase [Palleronia sediminis]